MRKLVLLFMIQSFLWVSNTVFCQVPPAEDVQLYISKIVGEETPDAVMDTLTDPFYLLVHELNLNVDLSLILPDTSQVSFIHVKQKSDLLGLPLLNYAFVYDQTNLTNGLTYKRDGNYLELGLAVFANTNHAVYYAEVELEDANGNKSIIVQTDSSNN
ncbi:MAG: hypothetical protein KDD41_06750 [Flavobacteriales bacterium]|nr:hypothetical protein [Flavobacteriales bacterium]